jgi:hypothetical protein
MTRAPVICFGQQPCGIFPKRFLFAKFQTARRLQKEIGGEIVFFYHDSDHDPRETRSVLRHRKTGEPFSINFTFENKLQRKYSPLYLKRVMRDWREKTAMQLPGYVDRCWVEAFKTITAANTADFCLEMYHRMGLLQGMRIVRSSNPALRQTACDVDDFYVDASYRGEIVRARQINGQLKLHAGGQEYLTLPATDYHREHISPARDTRLRWMQSIVHCTHYVAGAGEQQYLRTQDAPEIVYVQRDTIERSDEAYTEI